jgi:hypothetical protein
VSHWYVAISNNFVDNITSSRTFFSVSIERSTVSFMNNIDEVEGKVRGWLAWPVFLLFL